MRLEVVEFSREQRNATIGECLAASEQRSQDIYMQFLFRSNVKEGGRGEKKMSAPPSSDFERSQITLDLWFHNLGLSC